MKGQTELSIPRHVALIMDGNGRWAGARHLPRTAGHKAGIEALRRALRAATDFGIEYLSVYSFSAENWKRPKSEVTFLLTLLQGFITSDLAELDAAGVHIKVIGAREGLEPDLVRQLEEAETRTAGNSKFNLVVAFNYGSQQELARAARRIAQKVEQGIIASSAIDVATVEAALDTAGIPAVDLLIRTGGEERISNFLLWQSAYAEFVFMDEFWPDFNATLFAQALDKYSARERRFGGLKVRSV